MDIGRNLVNRIVNILFALDCFVFALLTIGGSYPSESFSSAAYRAEKERRFYGKTRPLIDAVFARLGQIDHCARAYANARFNLPPDEIGESKNECSTNT